MADNLRIKTVSGVIWSFAENFSLQAFSFVQGIILARLLMPSDYGLIAMTGIFFSISYCLIDSGFTTALIQKKERTEIDYSTVYVTNMALSLFFSLLLCACSSIIADFYDEPLLKKIVCVNAILMFCGSFIAVQSTRLTIQLDFKTKSIINVIATVTTGIVSIVLAFLGFGVWSLIYPNFASLLVKAFLFWRKQHWFPGFAFSFNSAKEFFGFGSKLMLTNLLASIYGNIYSLVIGKKYTAADLGYYSKAESYPSLISTTVTGMIGKVTFPVLCQINDDLPRLKEMYCRMLRVTCYVVFPLLMGLCALAKPLIDVLITSKWEPAVPYMQVLCFSLMWHPVNQLSLNVITALGRSDYILKAEILKKIVGISILVATIPMGIFPMCIGMAFNSLIAVCINTHFTNKLLKVGIVKHIKEIIPTIIISIIMLVCVWSFISFLTDDIYQIVFGIPVGIIVYVSISYLIKNSEFFFILSLVKEYLPIKIKK